jgi:flagellar basal-body rod protein FlgB
MLNGIDQFFATRMHALSLRAQRSEVLASNIANADTPNFKAQDFDFTSALQAAVLGASGRQSAPPMDRTAPGHLSGGPGIVPGADLQYRVPIQSSIDGNTVELDAELGQFTDNAIRYQADLTFLSNQIRLLQFAIAGQ